MPRVASVSCFQGQDNPHSTGLHASSHISYRLTSLLFLCAVVLNNTALTKAFFLPSIRHWFASLDGRVATTALGSILVTSWQAFCPCSSMSKTNITSWNIDWMSFKCSTMLRDAELEPEGRETTAG